MQTAVAEKGFYRFVYFSARHLKNRCSYRHQTWHRNVQRWVLETHSFGGQRSKVKVTTSFATLPLAAYVSHAGLSPLQCPDALAMLAKSGFPCVTCLSLNHTRQIDLFYARGVFRSHGTDRPTDGQTDLIPLHIRYLLDAASAKSNLLNW